MDILEKIVEQKKLEIAQMAKRPASAEHLRWAVKTHGQRRDFAGQLRYPRHGRVALIAEVKKASPSAGVIREDFDPVAIARAYEEAGASCISVLTDEKFFQGSKQYMRQIRDAVHLPILRKDFIIDSLQVLEAIEFGADAILLIVSILTEQELKLFISMAAEAGLDTLVEVHDRSELDRALAAGATIIGINNRDLRTFKVSLHTSVDLIAHAKAHREGHLKLFVAESGIHTHSDVSLLTDAGAHAILVGESLMREREIGRKVRELLEGS
ncbi:MAG TPA: indole-3-glycerol phosphate synthase TrpC [Verrucomicrobiae bacterium]|jgi:indole-3-glycerol phosphate synthase|nr:indole-3-glycerol phosphate synthase TrpC [Verrucomicrobiae bacterium]